MKSIFAVFIFFCSQVCLAGGDVHFEITDAVSDYFETDCVEIVYAESNVSVKLVDEFYEESESGYFYKYTYAFDVYYGEALVGEAVQFGEGAEAFDPIEEWDFNLNCPN